MAAKEPAPGTRGTIDIGFDISAIPNEELVALRAAVELEMRKRGIALSVGAVGEQLVIEHFRTNPGLPKLQDAPVGTKNVDALSRDGDRYSIKTVCNAKKTGTIYPDAEDREKQLRNVSMTLRHLRS